MVLLRYNSAVHGAYVDLIFKARDYSVAQYQRYSLLQQLQQAGQHDVEVPALLPHEYQYPNTIFLHELEVSPHDIANGGVASYFGLDSVRVKAVSDHIRRHVRE